MEEIINLIKEIRDKLSAVEDLLTNDLIKQTTKETNDFEELKSILYSTDWPEAVLEFQIVDQNSEEEKMERAEGIVDILIQDGLIGKKFLDFGCGEGHMAKYASKEAISSIGYEITKPQKSKFNWENKEENFLLTTDFQKVKEEGPYDIIMIYDVIDHAEGEGDAERILIKAKSVLKDTGKIYLRTHPWCGRHGGHMYRQINKAFVHLVFTEDELGQLGYEPKEKNIKIKYPIAEYEKIIKNSGLKYNIPEVENNGVEDFFKTNSLVSKRLIKAIPINNSSEFPEHQLKQCFHDYILTKE